LAWDPFSAYHCAILVNQPNIRLLYWDTRKSTGGISELFVVKNNPSEIVVIRWNLLIPDLLAAGCSNGSVILFYTSKSTNPQKVLSVPDRYAAVVDIQWDRLSSVYLLVAYTSCISLWDTENLTEIHSFDKQQGGMTAIAWLDWTAGNFISTNSKNGILKVWNVSQRHFLESIRVCTSGISTVYFGAGTKRAVLACLDGSIIIYHMVKMQLEYSTAAGHTETIFDCNFSPSSPDVLATASYDGTVKVWNIQDFSLTDTLYSGQSTSKNIIYSCDWSPKGKYARID
jgi:WD40 repeat protein